MPEEVTVTLKGGMYDGLEVADDPDLDYILTDEGYVYLQDGTLFLVLG